MIRFLDLSFSIIGIIILFPLLVLILLIIWLENGSPLFLQLRVGKNKKPFKVVKFRTMKLDTPSLGSHLVDSSSITKIGLFLRSSKIDELPQLWNVFKGEMSFVGPRPCLYNQKELIKEREARTVYDIRPGITGLAQINKINMSTPKLLAETDLKMKETMNIKNYFRYIILSIFRNYNRKL